MTDTPLSSASSMLIEEPTELWRHENPRSTQMWKLKEIIEKKYNQTFSDYHDFHRWSVENVAEFWEETWHFTNVVAKTPYQEVSGETWLRLGYSDDRASVMFMTLCLYVLCWDWYLVEASGICILWSSKVFSLILWATSSLPSYCYCCNGQSSVLISSIYNPVSHLVAFFMSTQQISSKQAQLTLIGSTQKCTNVPKARLLRWFKAELCGKLALPTSIGRILAYHRRWPSNHRSQRDWRKGRNLGTAEGWSEKVCQWLEEFGLATRWSCCWIPW